MISPKHNRDNQLLTKKERKKEIRMKDIANKETMIQKSTYYSSETTEVKAQRNSIIKVLF